jgi:DNA-binding transcriptional MerR regulator
MSGLKISEAARATGFSVSALRFYEQAGVVVPERTATGYRSYSDDHLDSLRFVARGKQLGLSLDGGVRAGAGSNPAARR